MGIIRRVKQDGPDRSGGDLKSLPRAIRHKLQDLIDDVSPDSPQPWLVDHCQTRLAWINLQDLGKDLFLGNSNVMSSESLHTGSTAVLFEWFTARRRTSNPKSCRRALSGWGKYGQIYAPVAHTALSESEGRSEKQQTDEL